MHYVLILVIWTQGYPTPVTATSAEFNTLKACENAGDAMSQRLRAKTSYICAEKG